jgi:hippurate hydrolase
MHNWPGLPVGQFAIRPGAFFASADQFEMVIEGRGGHAAKPHLAIDTTVVASHVVIALQSIASRIVSPTEQVVVSVTSFETSSKAHNVIPQTVHMRGTVRTMSNETRDLAEKSLIEIAQGTAAAFGATATVDYKRGYPVMVNHDEQTEFAAEVAKSVAGDCAYADQTMGGEDFAFMLEERPGAYIFVGNGEGADVHHPEYVFSDETMPAGCSWWAEIVEQRMPAG